ncbi:MAG: choice-of-anchor J domain-containing protein [Bacteroidia bacterium]|nr:choice-of-anchor J domain-containing protein [Bacteroidia bacterium]NND11004.1 hypothetical protein [Flavobacteriaceae bacterium]NNK28412.1 hypothetical protein [Flavobacteriaceae bacterium]RZV68727.1 MAG: hypothetical protein EX254_01895 [Flavobacteriaceae bacterium]
MKRIVYLLTILGLVFTGCDPLEDINNEIDSVEQPIVASIDYTLTDEDYEELELGFGSFDSEDQAKTLIPPFLADKYPYYGEGSSVNVGYNLYIGAAEGVSDFTGADSYELSNDDYATTGSDAFGFYPNVDATDEIPAILDTAIMAPAEGQIVLAEYEQYFEDPEIGIANLYQATFPANFGDFELISVSGPDALGWTSQSAYAQGSGFSGGAVATEEWLISPEVDLSGETGLLFQITQEIDFLGDPTLFDILISTDYTTGGDPMAATWTAIAFDKTIYGSMTTSEDFDFSAYDDSAVHVALKYSSTDADSPRWRVQDFAIRTVGVSGDTDSKGEFFTYSGGAWEASEDVYYLSGSDYDSMGEESGQPGRFDNFSSSTPAADYLDTFLGIKYPFAQEEDQLFVIYKYFSSSSGLGIRGNSYSVIDGAWVGHESTVATSLQFGYEDGIWVPDNTIRYSLSGEDVTFISEEFIDVYPGPADNVGFFGSFDRRSSSPNYWSDEMLLEAFNALLDNINPAAEEEQKYVLTFVIYNGATTNETKSVIKLGGEWVYQE